MEQNNLKIWADNNEPDYSYDERQNILDIWTELLWLFITEEDTIVGIGRIQQHDWYLYDSKSGKFDKQFVKDCLIRGLSPFFIEGCVERDPEHKIYFDIVSESDHQKFVNSVISLKIWADNYELKHIECRLGYSEDILGIWEEFLWRFTQKETAIATKEIKNYDWYIYEGIYGGVYGVFSEQFKKDCRMRGLDPEFICLDTQGNKVHFEIVSFSDYQKFVDGVISVRL